MPIDQRFASSILEVGVTFGFAEFACDPDDITAAFGVVPDEVRRKGDQRRQSSGRVFSVPFSSWRISSKVQSKDVNEHFREVLARLVGAAGRLDPRWGTPSFSVIYKATHLRNGNGPFFEADVVQGIASFGAELWQDIYSVSAR